MDYKEFSGKIKAKYPAYANMDDKELAQKMVAKFPQYSDVTFEDPASAEQQAARPQDAGALSQFGANPVGVAASAARNLPQALKETGDTFNAAVQDNQRIGQPFRAIANVGQMAAAPFNLAFNVAGKTIGDMVPQSIKAMASQPSKYNVSSQMTDAQGKPMGTLGEAAQGAVKTFERQPLTLRKMEEAALNLSGVVPGGMLAKKAVTSIAKSEIAQPVKKELMAIAKSEKGAIEIPDLGAETAKLESEMGNIGTAGNPILKKGSVNKLSEKTPSMGPLEKLAGINDREATILNVKTDPTDVPFSDYAIQAKKSIRGADVKTGAPISTPLDIVGKRGVEAHGAIDKIRKIKGAEKADYLQTIDDAIVETNSFVDPQNMKEILSKELESKLGLYIDNDGALKVAASGARNEALIPEAKKVVAMMNRMPREMTAQQLDALSANLRGFLKKRKASELKPSSDQIDIVVGNIRNQINKELETKANELLTPDDYTRYIQSKRDYANIKTIEEELSKALGREVIPGSDIASRGASIAKRMVQSNADAGSKALAMAVKKLTGIDLFKEANYAEIAMRAVGDPRAESLLQQGLSGAVGKGMTGAAIDVGKKVAQKTLAGNKLDRLIDYYNRKQLKSGYKYESKKAGKSLKDMVK